MMQNLQSCFGVQVCEANAQVAGAWDVLSEPLPLSSRLTETTLLLLRTQETNS